MPERQLNIIREKHWLSPNIIKILSIACSQVVRKNKYSDYEYGRSKECRNKNKQEPFVKLSFSYFHRDFSPNRKLRLNTPLIIIKYRSYQRKKAEQGCNVRFRRIKTASFRETNNKLKTNNDNELLAKE